MNPTAPESAGRTSLDAVLRLAWSTRAFTASDVITAIGLTRSTAIEATDELIALGLLRELPNARAVGEYRKGRPARRFELRADAAVVVGMDAGRGHLTTTVADLRGAPLGRHAVALGPGHDSADERRTAILRAVDDALAATGHVAADVLAICVGVPAPVDARGASPEHHDDFWHRMNPELPALLRDRAPIVRVENDAALAAVAEGAIGAAVGCRDFVTLLAGDRLGAGIVLDGRLIRGAHGGAGEMVAFDQVDGVRSAHGIAPRVVAAARAALADGRVAPEHPLVAEHPDELTGRRVLELADGDAPWELEVVELAAGVLARVAGMLGSLYDPARIVIAGGVADAVQRVVDLAASRLPTELDLPAPELVRSTLGADVVATGAVMGAVEAARTGVLASGRLPLARDRGRTAGHHRAS